jgi:uncharacterized caspase-like protein
MTLTLACTAASFAQPTVPATGIQTAEPAVATGQTWVLLIAVDNYRELGKLQYSCNDAKMLKERLVATGIPADHVTLMTDDAEENLKPIKRNFEQQLQAMLSHAGKEDLVMLTASIHGVSIDGVSYLCPLDTSLKEVQQRVSAAPVPETTTLISVPAIYQQMGQCIARRKLLILDSCRNTLNSEGRPSKTNTPLNLGQPPKGIWLVSSCRADQASLEDANLKHGLFMNFLIEGLDGQADSPDGNNDGKIQVFELYNYAYQRTTAYASKHFSADQEPVMRGEEAVNFDITTALSEGRRTALADAKASPTSRLIETGNKFLRQKKYDEAIEVFTGVIEANPNDTTPYAYRGVAYRDKGQFDLALADFQKAGKPFHLMVNVPKADLRVESRSEHSAQGGEKVEITQIHEGKYYWVASVNQDKQRTGWIENNQVSWSAPLVDTYLQPTTDRPFKYEESLHWAVSRAQELKKFFEELRPLFDTLPPDAREILQNPEQYIPPEYQKMFREFFPTNGQDSQRSQESKEPKESKESKESKATPPKIPEELQRFFSF